LAQLCWQQLFVALFLPLMLQNLFLLLESEEYTANKIADNPMTVSVVIFS
jgi:hypothetical protein